MIGRPTGKERNTSAKYVCYLNCEAAMAYLHEDMQNAVGDNNAL